ncbi:MAG: phosphatase PAP2 family protein [Pseudomonadota bacterium]
MSQEVHSADEAANAINREPGPSSTEWRGEIARRTLKTIDQHKWLIALMLIYGAVSWFLVDGLRIVGVENVKIQLILGRSLFLLTAVLLVAFLVLYCLYVMAFVRPDRLFRYLGRDLAENWATPERLTGAAIIYLLLPLWLSVFTGIKSTIPFLNPFSWDETFMLWDRALHFGIDPWRVLQPVLGYPIVTKIVDSVYIVWFFVMYAVLFWQAFSTRDSRLRMQFFMTFFLLWILLGNVLAVALSSGGPVYYGRITGLSDPYKSLMAYLHEVGASYGIFALEVQERLWTGYVNESPVGGGISAMPSLHVAMAMLFALLGFRVHKLLGVLLALYAVLILLGSVHLAWHYAVDGYLGALLAWAVWRVVGWLQRRFSSVT